MRRILGSLALLPLLVWSVSLSGQATNTLTAQEKAQGWQLLFDGKTLNGWHSAAPPQPRAGGGGARGGRRRRLRRSPERCRLSEVLRSRVPSRPAVAAGSSKWEVVDGALTPCAEPAGYLNSDQSFKNFTSCHSSLCSDEANSGVYARSPKEAGGYEVQIGKQQPAGYNTGAIVGTAKTARDSPSSRITGIEPQITADGDHLVVVLNGNTTLDIHDAKFPDGHIRLQYQQYPIAFRNVKIRPLP